MKYALVTGAAGFIGSHLCDALLEKNYTVIGLDDLSLGRKENLVNSLSYKDHFHFYEANVNDVSNVRAIIDTHLKAPFDVWLLAANSDIQAGVRDPLVDLHKTFLSTFHTLEALRDQNIHKIMFASTSAVYGDHDDVLSETTAPLLPISNYGAMKLASEAALSAFTETSTAQTLIFRFPNVVGPRSTHGILFDFFEKIRNSKTLNVLGDGSQEKQYLHVHELIDAMLIAYEKCDDRRSIFNIGVESSTTNVRAIAENFKRIVDPDLVLAFGSEKRGWVGDVPKFRLDTSKIRSLGWTAQRESTDSVCQAIQELLAERNSL